MTAKSKWRGHEIACDATDLWRYCDTGQPVPDDPDRDCGHCGLPNTPEGHDGCLGTIPGAANACCGHGIAREAYVQMESSHEHGNGMPSGD